MMTMAQIWTVIGVMAAALAATVTFAIRAMRAEVGGIRGEVDGLRGELRSEVAGLRGELRAMLEGLRNEMVIRFDHLDGRMARLETKVEGLDRDVHAVSMKVFGGNPPAHDP